MTKEHLLRLSGYELFQRQMKALREGKVTWAQLRWSSEVWLRHRGYLPTSLGWWKPEELMEMGAVQTASGEWVIGTEERRRLKGTGKDQSVQVYCVPERANAFFAKRRAANARFVGLLAATLLRNRSEVSESEVGLIAYARKLFGGEDM